MQTSLIEAEAKQKHAFIIEVKADKQFTVTPLPLQTVRPLIFDHLELASSVADAEDDEAVMEKVVGKLTEMIESTNHK